MNKLSYKNTLYCWYRFVGYAFFYFLIMFIPLIIVIGCLEIMVLGGLGSGFMALLPKLSFSSSLVKDVFSFGLFVVIIPVNLVICQFFVLRAAMNKLFFKSYKCFLINPKFEEKVPKKIVAVTMFLGLTLFMLFILCKTMMQGFHFGFQLLFSILFLFIGSFYITKYVVEENSTITLQDAKS